MKNELQDKSKISIYILFIWIACLVFGGVGALLVSLAVSASTANDTTLFAGVFELIFFDLAIFIVAIIIATKASKKVGLTVAGDKSFTKQLLRTMFFSIGGILLGLRAWLSVALSSRPPIFLPIGACLLALILLYVCASTFVFASQDLTRKKVWTPIVYLLALAMPSVILTVYATYLNLN